MQSSSGSQPDGPTLSPVGWQGRLSDARTRGDVVRLAREFVARITTDELLMIPDECRPTRIVDEDDVARYALILVQRSFARDRQGDATLQRIANFFTRASVRLAQISTQATAKAASE